MSIPILKQVYEETRRVAVAGSAVAAGDFRLKKLIPPLEQAGAKAPVFARVAQAATALVEAKEKDSPDALLELSTLVTAILYTQGETGAAGTLEAIETTELAPVGTQASARVLKPLLDALTTTGSGRVETIKDAHERGVFRDLRLMLPAVGALDDPYPEIAEFIADEVLPLYGKAIVAELQARFDAKGKAGDARRLRLLHRLDAESTRELVTQALEGGSRDVKVAAVECLGGRPEDLRYLVEQTAAKSREVRVAAYQALAHIDGGDAVAALEKVLGSDDLEAATGALKASGSARLVRAVIAAAETELAAAPKTKDKKDAGKRLARLRALANCLAGRTDADSEAFLLKLFAQRTAVAKVKGEALSGSDVNQTVVQLLEQGTPAMQSTLAAAHAAVTPEEFVFCFRAARKALPATEVYEAFAPYLTANFASKKRTDPASRKCEILGAELGGAGVFYHAPHKDTLPADPRWLDVAVTLGRLDILRHLGRPGHAPSERFLDEAFEKALQSSKTLRDCYEVVATMAHVHHPRATDAFVAAAEKHGGKADYDAYWFVRMIPELPVSALPRLEALVPKLNDRVADAFVTHLQQLREKA
jgi:hypothetical protein